jgi:hypothetical protein
MKRAVRGLIALGLIEKRRQGVYAVVVRVDALVRAHWPGSKYAHPICPPKEERMPWGVLIQAVQAVLTVAIQQIGRRQKSANDLVDETIMNTLEPQQRDALCKLGEMCGQAGSTPAAP